jgi:hypothetical protein
MLGFGCVASMLAGLSVLLQAEPDPYAHVVDLLRTRTIDAYLHRSLLEKRGLKEDQTDGFIGPEGREYTRRGFPVVLGPREEWPTVMGGTRFLLEPDRHARLRDTLRVLGAADGPTAGLIERVHVQGELWAAFDGLLQDGVLPLDAPERARWNELLELIALALRRVVLTDDEINSLPDGTALREHLFRKYGGGSARPIAYHTLQTPSLHDVSHRHRRLSRFYYWDPSIDFLNLDPEVRSRLKERSVDLNDGAVAMIEEVAVLVTRTGYLAVTNLPVLYKIYKVKRTPEGHLDLDFGMFHIDPKAPPRDPAALLAAGPGAEVWAKSNLPNIPGNGNKGPFRAPMSFVCSGCHSAAPIAFRPTTATLDPRYYQFTEEPYPSFPAARALQIKASSTEFEVLRAHLRGEGRFTGFMPTAAEPTPQHAPASGSNLTAVAATVGALVCVVTFFFLTGRRTGRGGGSRG